MVYKNIPKNQRFDVFFIMSYFKHNQIFFGTTYLQDNIDYYRVYYKEVSSHIIYIFNLIKG